MNACPESDATPLRQQLEALLQHARLNEEKMQRFDRLERQLIASSSLQEVLHLLLHAYKESFNLEFVTLALVDGDGETTRTLASETAEESAYPGLNLIDSPSFLESLYGQQRLPLLAPFSAENHGMLFDAPAGSIASVALLPLTRKGELIGSLHFGSTDPGRYSPDCGTNFLERLSAIIAICLESALTQERLKQVGLTDGLTGVQNRRYFEHRCQVEISQSRRYKHALACMFLDIDKFKRINDTYGHQSGDIVLRTVAGLIQASLRAGDTIARYGGEEFVVLLPQATPHHAREVAERIRCSIAERHFQASSGHEIRVTISIGLSMLEFTEGQSNPQLAEAMIARADKALYQAKQTGRNRVVADSVRSPRRRPQGQLMAYLGEMLFPRVSALIQALPKLKTLF